MEGIDLDRYKWEVLVTVSQREMDDDLRSLARLARKLDRPAVICNDPVRDAQPQTRPALFKVCCKKGVEYALTDFYGNPRTVIRYQNQGAIELGAHCDDHFAFRLGLDRIPY